ncbi:MAG TPA: hypothetical protein VER11_23680 [Polyangiaceae bacterium]|nr:hypothetical protein [Polyangiaceae bacterium]
MKKQEVVHQALQAALDSWNWRPPTSQGAIHGPEPIAEPGVQTELSTTVFSGEAKEWLRYLSLPASTRYEPDLRVRVHFQADFKMVAFEAENDDSRWLADLLALGLRRARKRLEDKPKVLQVFEDLLFGNARRGDRTVTVRLSPDVPSDGTREVPRDGMNGHGETRIVLHSRLARYVQEALIAKSRSADEVLGLCWPLVSRFVSQLGYPEWPRDRFVEKIDVFSRITFVSINVLYESRKSGHLIPSTMGCIFEDMVSESSGIPRLELMDRHPYFRMLNKLGFLLRGHGFGGDAAEVRVAACEYLDTIYLRLSLAGAMPEVAPAMAPMDFERVGRKVRTASPQVGSFGVLDNEDLEAWKTVADPFSDLGFTLLRQLGMGEFGRVYEALNDNSPNYPGRVALKVDRIVGKKKNAILEAEAAMSVGRALARAPHLMRLYDTGKLKGQRYTYHVLQLINGDTLDNLVGVTGTEHASVSRPPSARASELEARAEFDRAISLRSNELWRRQRMALPFTHALSPAMVMDLLTSVLLWMEAVHDIGYAINDLKNGNLMMSRRGQLKGIDLDSYAPAHSPKDKVTDFMFLAVSVILLLFSAPVANRGRNVPWEGLIESESRLREGLSEAWPFGNVEQQSDGRVSREELTNVLVDLVHRSRHLIYTKRPELFAEDIGRMVGVKHRLLNEELVID